MAAALTTTIKLSVSATLSEALDLGTRSFPTLLEELINLSSGTGAGKADLIFSDERTVAASGSEDLDVATGGGLVDAFGNAIAMAKLKAVIVVADPGNTNSVVVGRPASNGVPWMASVANNVLVQPGGRLLWVAPNAGVTVTAGTGDLITFANSAGGTSVTYKVVLIGASA